MKSTDDLDEIKRAMRAAAGKGPSRAKATRAPVTSIAKVEADRGRKNSRVKGSRAELDVARTFSDWCGEEVRRTPLSGGWSTARFGVTADLVCANPAFPFHVECFAAGTLVLTEDGYRPIETIKIGDKVLSHTGRWRKVTDAHPHGHERDVIKFTHGATTEPIIVTPDHPFETFYGWCPVGSATYTSHITQVAQYTVSTRRWLRTVSKARRFKVRKTSCDCGCGTRMSKVDARGRPRRFITGHSSGPALRTPIPKRVTLDTDLCYLLGLYIAKGHCDKDKVTWTFHRNETLLHSAVAAIVRSRFGVETTRRFAKHTKACAIIACSTNLSDTFKAWCSTGSRNKRLGWMVMLDDKRAWALVRGLFQGDGCISKFNARYNTKSKTLAYDLHALLLRLGVVSFVGVNKRKLYKVNVSRSCLDEFGAKSGLPCRSYQHARHYCRTYIRDVPNKHRIHFRKPKIDRAPRKAMVYNLSVERDESYVIQGNVVVHNCKHRERWCLDDLVTGRRSDGTESIVQWWLQCVRSCPTVPGFAGSTRFAKQPLLVFRRNRQPWLVMTLLGDENISRARFLVPDGVGKPWVVSVTTLETFLLEEPVPEGLHNHGSRP